MNSELLFDIADAIRNEPTAYDQDSWATFELINWDGDLSPENVCNTTNCIAGWAVRIGDPEKYNELIDHMYSNGMYADRENNAWSDAASELLGIDEYTAGTLFSSGGIPRNMLTVPEALEKMAAGTAISEVWTNIWTEGA